MESPLSFNASENFRKKLLLKNLEPYNTLGQHIKKDDRPKSEIVLVDYSVIDSPPIENVGDLQERFLFTQKQIYS